MTSISPCWKCFLVKCTICSTICMALYSSNLRQFRGTANKLEQYISINAPNEYPPNEEKVLIIFCHQIFIINSFFIVLFQTQT